MTLTQARALEHVRHALGRELAPELVPVDILNEAGEHLVAMAEWNWTIRPMHRLDVRLPITITDATSWTAGTLTLVSTGTFAGYTHVPGDELEVTGGTGLTTGFYEIARKVDDDTIILVTSPGPDTAGTLDGTMALQRVRWPTDFRALLGYQSTNSLLRNFALVTPQVLLNLRTSQILANNWTLYAALAYAEDKDSTSSTFGEQIAVAELWPDADQGAGVSIFYRAGWKRATTDTERLPLPAGGWMEPLYLAIVRAVAQGYEEADTASVDARLAEIRSGPIFEAASARDFEMQPDLGAYQGGAVQTHTLDYWGAAVLRSNVSSQ